MEENAAVKCGPRVGFKQLLQYLSTSPLWMLVFIFSVKCSTLACGRKWCQEHGPGKAGHPVTNYVYHLQISDVKRLLVDVGGVGSSGQAPDAGQVPTVASHGLDDEHAPLGSAGRLLDAVASLMRSAHIRESNSPLSTRTRHHSTDRCR